MGSVPQLTMDLSHHINVKSRARHPSPMKDIIKYLGNEGMISLAGGLPHPSLFPFQKITFSASTPEFSAETRTEVTISESSDVPLAKLLQYGNAAGNDQLRKWCHEFTQRVYQPAYAEFEVLCNPGNTNAWSKIVGLLLEDGDHVLCEEYTYPSAQALFAPLGNYAAPIPLDERGMRADLLEERLANWESTHAGKRRPHVMYVVPVGSNPSGITYSAERKKEIYDICVKYGKLIMVSGGNARLMLTTGPPDIIIVEDDPYFFLQFPSSKLDGESNNEVVPNDAFVESLSPSFLRYDYQGRVIRLESFSKTLAPGLRLGYFVANPVFTERLLRASEVETQDPSGLSQAFVLGLLQSWGQDGYIRWLQSIRIQYQQRRDWMVAAFAKEFKLLPAGECADLPGAQGVVAVLKSGDETKKAVPVFSFVPPTGGMFIWAKLYLSSNPSFKKLLKQGNALDPEQTFANQLWQELIGELLLLTPGSYFHPWQGKEKTTTQARGADAGTAHLRFSFATTTREDMEKAIKRFADVVRKSWQL